MINRTATIRKKIVAHSTSSSGLTVLHPSETLATSLVGALDYYEVGSSSMATPKHIVFVVDDDVWVRESLETLIRDEGWQAETFASAQEFLNRPRALR